MTGSTYLSKRPAWLARLGKDWLNPVAILGAMLTVVLGYLVLVPVFEMLAPTVTDRGQLSFATWQDVLTSRSFLHAPLMNTLKVSLWMTGLSLLIGCLLAWIVVRTDLPWRRFIDRLTLVPYIIPSWVTSLAWISLFRDSTMQHGQPGMLQAWFGIHIPTWWTFGMIPIIINLALHYFPYTYLLVANALRSVDSSMEEAGAILGASRSYILFRVTFPLILPALVSAFILTFSKGLGTFGVPAILGPPERFFVLSTIIYALVQNRFLPEAYVLATITTILGILTVYVNVRLLKSRRSFVTISGKGFRSRPQALGRWRWLVFGAVATFLFATVAVPLGVLALESTTKQAGRYSVENLTTHFWIGPPGDRSIGIGEAGLFRNPAMQSATRNSLVMGVSAGFLSGLLGVFIGYVVVKMKGRLVSAALEQFAFLPYLLPSIPFALAYLVMFAQPRLLVPALYGTMALLILITTVNRLPFASRIGISGMTQVSGEFEEAGVVLGARWGYLIRRISLPLLFGGLVSGFVLSFISVMRELSLLIMLVTPETRPLTTLVFTYTELDVPQTAAALALWIVFLTAIIYFPVQRWTKGNLLGQSTKEG